MQVQHDDSTLVATARKGDREAMATLLARHRPLLMTVCRRALGDAELAEDAAQEACLQAWLSLDRLRRPERFGSWLVGIGLNYCQRLRRHRMREAWSWEAMLGGQRLPDTVDLVPGPDDHAEAVELRAWIDHAVAGLPPGQQSAVMMHYLSGLTQAETAAILGIEISAVKSRLHKARANLRRELWRLEPASQVRKGGRALDSSVEMRVADVRRGRADAGQDPYNFVVLEEIGGERSLPIWIGEFEATAMALHLAHVTNPRPLTYAFTAEVLQAADGRLREVRIDRLEGDVFIATAVVAGPDSEREVDARPSDALNLALVLGAPIQVSPGVLAATADCPSAAWAQREALTNGAAVIAAQVVADRDNPAGQSRDKTPASTRPESS